MGHHITAIITSPSVIGHLLEGRPLVACDLQDGWKLVPLEGDDLDSFGLAFGQVLRGFTYLSTPLLQFLAELSHHGPLAYVETDYFGGTGTQAAVSFAEGATLAPTPSAGEGAINQALRAIGITFNGAHDEFDHIGLSKHRHTEDWKDAALRKQATPVGQITNAPTSCTPEVFHTDTSKIKKGILGLTAFIAISMAFAASAGGRNLLDSATLALSFAAAFFTFMWIYAHYAIFHRTYTIDESGITLSKKDLIVRHIPWHQVKSIGSSQVRVTSTDNTKIIFNLPPEIQTKVRIVIEKFQHPATLAPTPQTFHADNVAFKKAALGMTLLIAAFLFITQLPKGHILETIIWTLAISGVVFASMWIYGHYAIFDRTYTIDEKGITLSKNDQVLRHIPWHRIRSIGDRSLVATSADGVKIAFNLPIKAHIKARVAIGNFQHRIANTTEHAHHA